ncbi:MAG: hypothetical protein AAGG07_12680 [Planctomycetota bacterium]
MIDQATTIKVVAVGGSVTVLFALLAALVSRGKIEGETSRKSAHVLVGATAVSIGWLFDDSLPVAILSGLALTSAVAVRVVPSMRSRFGAVVHGVDRRSFGDCCFPAVVPVVHWLAMPDVAMYVIPVLVLTLADSAAALVGKRFGCWAYRTDEGSKTVEGSAALGAVTGIVVFAGLLLAGQDFFRAGSTALLVTILVVLAEAVCWRGLDNIVLPMGTLALLRMYDTMPDQAVLQRVVVALLICGFAVAWRGRAGLIGAAGLAAAFVVYASWALGGLVWAIPPLAILVALPFFGGRWADTRDEDLGVGVVLSMGIVPLLWLFLHETELIRDTLGSFLAAWAAVLGLTLVVRWRRDRLIGAIDRLLIPKTLLALVLIASACCLLPGGFAAPRSTAGIAGLAFASALILEGIGDLERRGIGASAVWSIRTGIVAVGSSAGFAPLLWGGAA